MVCMESHKTFIMKVETESKAPKPQSGTLNRNHLSSSSLEKAKTSQENLTSLEFSCALFHSPEPIHPCYLEGLKLFTYLLFSNLVSLGDWHTREIDV